MVNFYWIDAFAEGPFTGNPAAVVLLEGAADEAWMRKVAFEMGLSETAFVFPENGKFRLRWFTPQAEVDLCGHATLATTMALLDSGRAHNDQPIRFETKSGELRAWRRNDNGLIEMDFPEEKIEPCPPPDGILAALGLMSCGSAARAGQDFLIEAEDEAAVRELSPEFSKLKEFGPRGVCVTARADGDGADFVSRFFGPAVGINEDPVTGSAHCYLAPYWAGIVGSTEMVGRQISRRGGRLHVSLKNGRVFIGGEAKILVKGSLEL